jgi:hypothetical protein
MKFVYFFQGIWIMPITDHKNYSFSFSMIDIKKIDPYPYQHRKYFDENSLRELGASYAGWID